MSSSNLVPPAGAMIPIALSSAADVASAPLDDWGTAMSLFARAREAEVAFDLQTWKPAFDAERSGGSKIPDAVDAQSERLTDLRCDAEEALVHTPAPSLSAVIWKLDYGHKRWEDSEWPDDWWDAVMSDLRRLNKESMS